jgi:hypothetical protein
VGRGGGRVKYPELPTGSCLQLRCFKCQLVKSLFFFLKQKLPSPFIRSMAHPLYKGRLGDGSNKSPCHPEMGTKGICGRVVTDLLDAAAHTAFLISS